MSVLTTLLFVAGASLFAWPALTDLYTNQVVQNQLADEYEQLTEELQQFELSVGTFDEYEAAVAGQDGVALTKIAIPAIGVETLVVEGTSPSALRAGAGHYVDTPLPGEAGNVAIAGHRTTYGRPFNRLDELGVGDTIWLATPVGDHEYRIVGEPASSDCNPTDRAACITGPSDWSVVSPGGGDDGSGADATGGESWLTLTTCHPKGSAAQRLIIRAELVESLPRGHLRQPGLSGRSGASGRLRGGFECRRRRTLPTGRPPIEASRTVGRAWTRRRRTAAALRGVQALASAVTPEGIHTCRSSSPTSIRGPVRASGPTTMSRRTTSCDCGRTAH